MPQHLKAPPARCAIGNIWWFQECVAGSTSFNGQRCTAIKCSPQLTTDRRWRVLPLRWLDSWRRGVACRISQPRHLDWTRRVQVELAETAHHPQRKTCSGDLLGYIWHIASYSAMRSFFDLLVCWLFESQEWGTRPDQAYHGAQQHCREVQPEVLPSDLGPFCGPSIWQEQHHSIGLRPQMPTTKKDTQRYPKSNVLWRWTIQSLGWTVRTVR